MGTQDNDILGYFEGEHDQAEANSPSTDNLFSNRDVLERRLKCRLDREDLVVRGILPANHAAPNILAQIHQLERAKTGDILQKKIRVRSSRQQLVQRHILADSKIDASLQEKQTALERHRIADSLNEQLFNRPGPLELIRENILKVEPNFADAVKHGCVPFHPTCRDVSTSPIDNLNIDSPLSDIDGSRCSLESLSPLGPEAIDTFSQAFSEHVKVDNFNVNNNVSSAVSELEDCLISTSDVFSRDNSKYERSRESLIRKQSKNSKKKQQSQNKQKIKKYKYHEYKPPGVVPATYQAPLDDRYKRLLEQQQMFLQLQVMKQNALFAAISGNPEQPVENQVDMEENPVSQSETPVAAIPSSVCIGNSALDDLRVTELRSALRMRGLPVSGSKAKLLERLKSYEDKRRAESEETQVEGLAPSSSTQTAAEVNEANTISTSTCTNAFIKVTTYASQSGETFQLVQAVPNMPTTEIQYHLMPSSVVLGPAQPTFPVQHLGVQTGPQTDHVVQMTPASQHVDQRLLSSVVSSPITHSRQDGLPHIIGQPMNQPVNQPLSPAQHIQVQFSQPSINSLASSSNLDIIGTLEQSQPTVIDPLALQMLSSQLQQAVKSQASIQTQTSQEAPESEGRSHASLLSQMPQLKPQITQGKEHIRSDLLLTHTDSGDNLQAGPNKGLTGSYQWNVNNNKPKKDSQAQTKVNLFNDQTGFRNRSQTDPLRSNTLKSTAETTKSYYRVSHTFPSNCPVEGYATATCGSSAKSVGKDLRMLQLPTGISDLSMNNSSRASDDLMDILGELSSSASSEMTEVPTQGSHAVGMFDTSRGFLNILPGDVQVKEENMSHLQPKSTQSCATMSHRPYGSFPGDLNCAGVSVNEAPNMNHGSLRDLSNRTSCNATNSQELHLNPHHITDIEMESEAPYFSQSNDLEWLDLNTLPSMNSTVDRQTAKSPVRSKEHTHDGESLQLDLLSTSLFENNKSQDALSIFDLDGSHSLMMVDSNESEKWDF